MYKHIEKRFWSKVNIRLSDDCWKWKASLRGKGYGQFWVSGRNLRAHRVAWEITNGSIPVGKKVLHKCDNRKCCNPKHLYLGTQSDNNSDRAERNCMNQGGGQSKLHDYEILKIRSIIDRSQASIAQEFNVSQMTVSKILRLESYPCKEGYSC